MVRENYFAQINYELSDSDPNIQNPGVLTWI
jgi:hypothetical protein